MPIESEIAQGLVPGALDDVDSALLRLSRLVLAATVRAGNAMDPVLSATQIRTLTVLAPGDGVGLSLTAVADALGTSRPSASRICKRLVRDGLVHRAAGPGNELRLTLTDDGLAALTTVNRLRVTHLRAALDSLPPEARTVAVDAFEHMADGDGSAELW